MAKRKPLEPWQKEDAMRLKALWEDFSRRTKLKQEDVLEHFGFTQGAFSQYINGRLPLNLETLLNFAHLMKCRVSEVSPTLSALLYRWVNDAERNAFIQIEQCLGIEDINLLSEAEKRAVETMIRHFIAAKEVDLAPGKQNFKPRLVKP